MTSPDMDALLAQAQQMQAQLQEAQQKIVASEVVGESGNGLVKVRMRGSGQLTDVSIDPQVVDPDDVDTLQDLIVGAFADATAKITELAQTYMGPLQGVLGDNGISDMLGGGAQA